jgi:hypothetical protein
MPSSFKIANEICFLKKPRLKLDSYTNIFRETSVLFLYVMRYSHEKIFNKAHGDNLACLTVLVIRIVSEVALS